MAQSKKSFMYEVITSPALVQQVTTSSVIARLTADSNCDTNCATCGMCSGGEKRPLQKVILRRKEFPDLKPGQRVALTRTILNPGIASILVFGLPLLCAVVAAACAPAFGFDAETVPGALLVTAALAAGFGLVAIIDRAFGAAFPPVCANPDNG